MSCLVDTQRYFPPTPLPKLSLIQPTDIFNLSIGHVFWIKNDSLQINDLDTEEHPCVVIELEIINKTLTGYAAVLSSKKTGYNECIAIDISTVHGVSVGTKWKANHFVTSVNQFTMATIAPSKYRYLGMITPESLIRVENASFGKNILWMSYQPPILSPLMESRKIQWQQKQKREKDAIFEANRKKKAQKPTFDTSNPFNFSSDSE